MRLILPNVTFSLHFLNHPLSNLLISTVTNNFS
nr:MAG TPA: hypothetical protein [Caudoviricetes sp.]